MQMNAKEFCQQYYRAKLKMDSLRAELQILRESIADIQATDYTKVVVDGTKAQDTIGNLVAELVEVETDLWKAAEEQCRKMLDVMEVINEVDDPLTNKALTFRHVELLTWQEMEERMHYSDRQLQRIVLDGYEEVQRILNRRN